MIWKWKTTFLTLEVYWVAASMGRCVFDDTWCRQKALGLHEGSNKEGVTKKECRQGQRKNPKEAIQSNVVSGKKKIIKRLMFLKERWLPNVNEIHRFLFSLFRIIVDFFFSLEGHGYCACYKKNTHRANFYSCTMGNSMKSDIVWHRSELFASFTPKTTKKVMC